MSSSGSSGWSCVCCAFQVVQVSGRAPCPPVIPLTMYLVPPRQVGNVGWPLAGRVRSTDWLGSSGRWAHAFPNPDTQDPRPGHPGHLGTRRPLIQSIRPPSLPLPRSLLFVHSRHLPFQQNKPLPPDTHSFQSLLQTSPHSLRSSPFERMQ